MNSLAITSPDLNRDILNACAKALHLPERLDELAAGVDLTPDELAAKLLDPVNLPQISRRLAELRQSGELLADLAMPALEKFLRRAEGAMDDPGQSLATLAKVADTAHKISGLADARSAAQRRAEKQPTGAGLQFTIIAPNGEVAFSIGTASIDDAPGRERVIDAEVLDDD